MSPTPLALFNGSYLGRRPTGIGVVARDLVAALDPAEVPLLDPLGSDRPGSLPIPDNLGLEHGRAGHLRRLLWTQNQLPGLLRRHGAPLLLSPLPEAPLLRGVRSLVLAHDLLPLRYPQLTPLLAYHLAYVPLVLHRAVRVLCNSEATAREAHGRLGVPSRRLVPIRLGFDPGLLRPLGLAYLSVLHRDPAGELVQELRQRFGGPLMANSGFGTVTTREEALALIEAAHADTVAVGRPVIANPDLVERWKGEHPENAPNAQLFYASGAEGYTDYPTLAAG